MKRVQSVTKLKMSMIQSCGEGPWVLPGSVHGEKYVGEHTTTLISRRLSDQEHASIPLPKSGPAAREN